MPDQFDYSMVPDHCRDGVRAYIEHGHVVGGFLRAVFENNLVEAVGRADDINRYRLEGYARFLHNEAPASPVRSWGSPETVDEWIAMGGMDGLLARTEEEGNAV